MTAEQRKKVEEMEQDMEHISIQIDFQTKNIVTMFEKTNVVGQENSYIGPDIDEKLLGKLKRFQNYISINKGYIY